MIDFEFWNYIFSYYMSSGWIIIKILLFWVLDEYSPSLVPIARSRTERLLKLSFSILVNIVPGCLDLALWIILHHGYAKLSPANWIVSSFLFKICPNFPYNLVSFQLYYLNPSLYSCKLMISCGPNWFLLCYSFGFYLELYIWEFLSYSFHSVNYLLLYQVIKPEGNIVNRL